LIDEIPEREVTKKMDRKEALILLSVVALVAIVSSTALTAYASGNGETISNSIAGWFNGMMMGPRGLGGRCGGGRNGFIEVSPEYNQTIINIAESDSDVQKLLAEGYTISAVRPIIKSVVEADGSVVTKATSAVVMLVNGTTGRAAVWVDLEAGKVTRIVISTITVIEKS
jgi:hypothetical protein